MSWNHFPYFALVAVLLWATGAYAAWKNKKHSPLVPLLQACWCFLVSLLPCGFHSNDHLCAPWAKRACGIRSSCPLPLVVYLRWRYKWILSFSTILATVFIMVNVLKPEIHNKTLMPALQSPWFAPHVIVYMFAYALLGAATVMAIYLLFIKKTPCTADEMDITDNLVYVGLSFMTLGMLMGAFWAKEAWGHYWAWDPKETWAAVTWFAYLCYVHFRRSRPYNLRPALYMLIVSFLLLQMCWWGINYLPAAQGTSVHTYNLS